MPSAPAPPARAPRSRRANLLLAVATGGVFLAGLLVHGALAALLLLLVAAFLVVLSRAAWHVIPPAGRRARVLIVAVVLAVALVKLVAG